MANLPSDMPWVMKWHFLSGHGLRSCSKKNLDRMAYQSRLRKARGPLAKSVLLPPLMEWQKKNQGVQKLMGNYGNYSSIPATPIWSLSARKNSLLLNSFVQRPLPPFPYSILNSPGNLKNLCGILTLRLPRSTIVDISIRSVMLPLA